MRKHFFKRDFTPLIEKQKEKVFAHKNNRSDQNKYKKKNRERKKKMPGTPGLFNWPVYVYGGALLWYMVNRQALENFMYDPTVYKMNDPPVVLPKFGDKGIVHTDAAAASTATGGGDE